MSRSRAWVGRLFFGTGKLLYAGTVAPTAHHAHHGFQIVAAIGGSLGLADDSGMESQCSTAVIPPDAAHAITRPFPSAIMLYVDPESVDGRCLRRLSIAADEPSWVSAGAALAPVRIDALPAHWDDAARVERDLLRALIGETTRPRPLHPAVMRAVAVIERELDQQIRLEPLARNLGLSASRLAHLFSAEVGIPLRRYVLWCRMQRAARDISVGASLTDAAHAGGFTDSAHMNHAFRRMFGLAPSDVLDAVEWVLPPK